jgi:hypothetical protein
MRYFDVEVKETYPGSEHCLVNIYIRGYGAIKKRWKLICIDDLPEELQDELLLRLDESNGGSFRPEYAKAIKRGLEYDPYDESTITGKMEKRLHDVISRNWQLERMCAEYERTIEDLKMALSYRARDLVKGDD